MSEPEVPAAIVRGAVPEFAAKPGELAADVTIVPTYKLFSAGHVAGATFLGGPLAGAIVMAVNYARLREPGKARLAVILGVLGTAALVAFAMTIGGAQNYSYGLPIVGVIVMRGIATSAQGRAFDLHLQNGGKRASGWPAAGIGAACLVAVVGAFFGLALGLELGQPPHVNISKGHDVFYRHGGTEAEAKQIGDRLATIGYFLEDHEAAVVVEHVGDHHVVGFVVNEHAIGDTKIQGLFRQIGRELSNKVFHGEPVDVVFESNQLEPKVTLLWGEP